MVAVLISIKPKWCDLILRGEKTIEVRKSRPKLQTPFKCYIYCTQGTGKNTLNIPVPFERIRDDYIETGSMKSLNCPIGNGKVVGEFICKSIGKYPWVEIEGEKCYFITTEEGERTGLNYDDVVRYGAGQDIYLWGIENMKIYDKPLELTDFGIDRAPQDWRYVDERQE